MGRRGSRLKTKRREPRRCDPDQGFRLAGELVLPGSAFCSGVLIKAFVWQVSASDDEVLVTLDYDVENNDVENNEPARLDVQRVRAKYKWCTVCASPRTEVCAVGTIIFVRIPRAA